MKRYWILLPGLALVAAVAAFMAAPYAACSCGSDPLVRVQRPERLARMLDLTQDQQETIEALHADWRREVEACSARHCMARTRLCEWLVREEADPDRVKAWLDEMGRAYVASELATVKYMDRIRAALDPEQRRRFNRKLADAACRACSACSHGSSALPHGQETNE